MEQPQYHLQSVVHAKESLEDFDGPLDVILLLLSKNKIEIQDVSISSILEQYLAWLWSKLSKYCPTSCGTCTSSVRLNRSEKK